MKSFLSTLFGRKVTFGKNISNFVNVVDSGKERKNNDIINGYITNVDFSERVIEIKSSVKKYGPDSLVVKFDDVVTISRMRDGRLRMWIKVED